MKVAVVYHENFKRYNFGPGHPLRGEYMDGDIAFNLVKNNRELLQNATIEFIEPTYAAEEDILAVHTDEYIDFIKKLNVKGGLITLDTPLLKGMYDVARLFAGADILGGKLVLDKVFNKSFVFGTMGHHVGSDFGGGFGIINDVAIMIQYLRTNYHLSRIALIDYSANTGHGTQQIFYDTSDVLCIDIHQDPLGLYPGTGFSEQVGKKEGQGYTVNIPVPAYTSDQDFLLGLKEIAAPIINEYNPQLIIGVGLNGSHFTVKINQLMLTIKGLKDTVQLLSKLSDNVCNGKFVHIGGFSVDTKLLPLGFLATVAGALDVGIEICEPYDMPENLPNVTQEVMASIARVKSIHKKYWKCFN